MPGLHDILHREHAAARGDQRSGSWRSMDCAWCRAIRRFRLRFPDGRVVPWWADRDRAVAEFRKISAKDAETFVRVDDQLKKLARYLQPFFLEPPPEIDTEKHRGMVGSVPRGQAISEHFQRGDCASWWRF